MDYYDDTLPEAERRRRYEESPQGRDEKTIFGEIQPPCTQTEALLDNMLVSSFRRIPLLAPMERQASSIYPHVWDLMQLKPPQRRRAVRKPPYRDLSLANLLLNESAKSLPRYPKNAVAFAEAAEWIAGLPWPAEKERAASTRVRAWIAQGDGLREARDWAGAELRFGAAFAILQEIPAGPGTYHVHFCRKLSELREDQGRPYEAAVLHLNAMHLHCKHFRAHELSTEGLVHLAFLALKQNDLSRAMSLFTSLCERDRTGYWSELDVDFGRAICLVALGLTEPAKELLEQTLPKRQCIDDRARRLPYEWLESRISLRLGDYRRAIPRLEALRRWVLGRGSLVATALCSIDLALAYAIRGGLDLRLPGLLRDLNAMMAAAENPWAPAALTWFREALREGQDPVFAARQAAELIHRRENPVARLAPSE